MLEVAAFWKMLSVKGSKWRVTLEDAKCQKVLVVKGEEWLRVPSI